MSPPRSDSPPNPPANDQLRKVYLEITTDCNMSCGMCIRHVWGQTSESIAPAVYEKLLAQLRGIPSVSTLNLGGFGEPLGEIWTSPRYRALRKRFRAFDFSPCIDCGGCDLRATNEDDCFGSGFPSCGDCLWAAGFIQCP